MVTGQKPERRVWIAQCLCGPQRHCIAALIDEADDQIEAERKLRGALHEKIEGMLRPGRGLNPWCALCGAEREGWHIELGRSRFRTMAEAEAPLRESEAEQIYTSLILGTHGPVRPGKA